MVVSSPYTVKTLLLYLADLEKQKQTAQDIADPDEDCANDPGWQKGREVENSYKILRKWPGVERTLRDCEADGCTFDAKGMNQWVALHCKAHNTLPSDVASWSLDQFCDIAEMRIVDSGNEPSLTKEAAAILHFLAERHPVQQSLDDIETGADVSRATASKASREVVAAGYAERPNGPNKGLGLTAAGKAVATKLSTK